MYLNALLMTTSSLAYSPPRPFLPPWWSRSPHIQTLLGSDKVNEALCGPWDTIRNFNYSERKRYTTTSGDDYFDVDWLYPPNAPNSYSRVAVLLHGLESSSSASRVTRVASRLAARGITSAALSHRSCSLNADGSTNMPLTAGAYHLGFTTDLNQLILSLPELGTKQIYLSGSSFLWED